MAALDVSTSDSEPAQVMCGFEGRNYLLCTLKKPDMIQCQLDLNFAVGAEVSFAANGKSHVHLTGYLTDEFPIDYEEEAEEEEDEDIEEEEDEEEQKAPLSKKAQKKRAKAELVNGQQKKKIKLEDIEEEESSDEDYVATQLEEDDDDDEDEDAEEEDSSLDDEEANNEVIEAEEGSDDDDEDDEDGEDGDEEEEEDDEQEKQSKKKPKMNGLPEKQKKQKKNQEIEESNKAQKQKEKNKQQQQQQQQQKGQKKTLQGGVVVEDLKEGQGAPAKSGRFVSVYYEGRLKNTNKLFDSATKGNGFRFRLGAGEVIKGWDIGVAGMKVGGKRRIICPPQMAYGQKGSPPAIPPNSTLVFEVEMKKIS